MRILLQGGPEADTDVEVSDTMTDYVIIGSLGPRIVASEVGAATLTAEVRVRVRHGRYRITSRDVDGVKLFVWNGWDAPDDGF